jgi:hypothetical protein
VTRMIPDTMLRASGWSWTLGRCRFICDFSYLWSLVPNIIVALHILRRRRCTV